MTSNLDSLISNLKWIATLDNVPEEVKKAADVCEVLVGALRRVDKDLSGAQTVVREAIAQAEKIAKGE